MDYTVIGDSVNIAQRLQSVAGHGQIIISEYSYEKIKESFNCKRVGEVVLKNKSKPLVIYEVID
ncbi:adenylate/guanylate cyclase domain-containing protein [Hydrotalea sp.]|uniref:adenylate/guanylate cyclase domain-containing protein n=1 Tax=Hydrotalea sp. TaxID=2881279 RepID=UPI003D0D4D7B